MRKVKDYISEQLQQLQNIASAINQYGTRLYNTHVDPREFGAKANGTDSDSSALADCLLAVTNGELVAFTTPAQEAYENEATGDVGATYKITTDHTISNPVWIQPGVQFSIDAGVTLTFDGPVLTNQEFSSIFTGSGSYVISVDDRLTTFRSTFEGGTTGQVLKKVSGTDYDYTWQDESGGGGGDSMWINALDPPGGLTPAVADNATDNAAAFQAMIDYANAQGGGTVYVPAGSYRTGSALVMKRNTRLIGEGVGTFQVADPTTYMTSIRLIAFSNSNIIEVPFDAQNVEIAYLTLDGAASANTGNGIVIGEPGGSGGKSHTTNRIHGIKVFDVGGDGIYIYNEAWIYRFYDIVVDFCTGACIRDLSTDNIYSDLVLGHGDYGFYFDGASTKISNVKSVFHDTAAYYFDALKMTLTNLEGQDCDGDGFIFNDCREVQAWGLLSDHNGIVSGSGFVFQNNCEMFVGSLVATDYTAVNTQTYGLTTDSSCSNINIYYSEQYVVNAPSISGINTNILNVRDRQYGTTVNRPTAPLSIGFQYFDTTLQLPVWWSGAAFKTFNNGAVDSVFGRTGIVTAQSGDYSANQITNFDTTVSSNSDVSNNTSARIPAGGTGGQVLKKIDGADYNTQWANESGGGGGDVQVVIMDDTVDTPTELNSFLSTNNGKQVRFREGYTFVLDEAIFMSGLSNMIIDGNGCTLQIEDNPNFPSITIGSYTGSAGICLGMTNCQNITILNLNLDGGLNNVINAATYDDCFGTLIDDCRDIRFIGGTHENVNLHANWQKQDVFNCTYENIEYKGNYGKTVASDVYASGLAEECFTAWVNCTAYRATVTGDKFAYIQSGNTLFHNIRLENIGAACFDYRSGNHILSGVDAYNCAAVFIVQTTSHTNEPKVVATNIIGRNIKGLASLSNTAVALYECQSCMIKNMDIEYDTGSGTNGVGILIRKFSDAYVLENIMLSNIRIKGTTTYGIWYLNANADKTHASPLTIDNSAGTAIRIDGTSGFHSVEWRFLGSATSIAGSTTYLNEREVGTWT